MSNFEKAYNRGHRMGVYVIEREGINNAAERGSLAHRIYRTPSMVKAYDDGYNAAINETR